MQAHVSVSGQPWVPSGNQGAAVPTPVPQSGQQPSSTTFTDSVSTLFIVFHSIQLPSTPLKDTNVMTFVHATCFDI